MIKCVFIKAHWLTLCFISRVNAIFQSFFHKFLYRFMQNLCAEVRNLVFIICSLLVGIDCEN